MLAATAIFYVYPKIVNTNHTHAKTASSKVVKNETKQVKTTNNDKKSETGIKRPKTTTTQEAKKKTNLNEYFLPSSNSERLTEVAIQKMTKNELRLARNEIYARHGLIFKSGDLNQYFSTKSWYSPNPTYNGDLNEIEKYNINLIKTKENSMN